MNDIPNPTGGAIEALIRRVSNLVDPAERIKIGVLETESVSMARLLLKKARASMNVDGKGGAPAIASFEQALYHFAISFGELCSKVRPTIDQEEIERALWQEHALNARKKQEPGNKYASKKLTVAVILALRTNQKAAAHSLSLAQSIRPHVRDYLASLDPPVKGKPKNWPSDSVIKGVLGRVCGVEIPHWVPCELFDDFINVATKEGEEAAATHVRKIKSAPGQDKLPRLPHKVRSVRADQK